MSNYNSSFVKHLCVFHLICPFFYVKPEVPPGPAGRFEDPSARRNAGISCEVGFEAHGTHHDMPKGHRGGSFLLCHGPVLLLSPKVKAEVDKDPKLYGMQFNTVGVSDGMWDTEHEAISMPVLFRDCTKCLNSVGGKTPGP